MSLKRIGIITFWESSENYGQLAQASALQIFLEKKGFEPFLIRYNKQNSVRANKPGKLQSILQKDWSKITDPGVISRKLKKLIARPMIRKDRRFNEFRNDFLKSNSRVYQSYEELVASPPDADVYITGSDQVWNHKYIGDPRPFFLKFGPRHIKRMAYAASFGHAVLPKNIFNQYKSYIHDFDAVSVREQSGVDLCTQMGYYVAELLPDPTLLIDKEDWKKYSKPAEWSTNSTDRTRVFAYTIGNRSSKVKDDAINYFKGSTDFEFRHTSVNNDYSGNIYPTLPEWIDYYKHADLIVTNSYHGIIFSIIFNKNFVALPCSGDKAGMNERLNTLLEKLHLSSHILPQFDSEKINEILRSEIDWIYINETLKNWVKEADHFVKGLMVEG